MTTKNEEDKIRGYAHDAHSTVVGIRGEKEERMEELLKDKK